MRTATSSHSSPEVEVSDDAPGVPPNHHTLREVDDDVNDDGSLPMLCILRDGNDDDCLYKICENEPEAVAMLVNASTLPILPDDRRTHPLLSIEFLIIVMEIRSVVVGAQG